jgi:hypothetical protein
MGSEILRDVDDTGLAEAGQSSFDLAPGCGAWGLANDTDDRGLSVCSQKGQSLL